TFADSYSTGWRGPGPGITLRSAADCGSSSGSADVPESAQAVSDDRFIVWGVTRLARRRWTCTGHQRPALHRSGDLVATQLQQGRRDIQEVGPDHFTPERAVGSGQDERAELSVVAVVGPGVVLQHVDDRIAD